MGRLNPHSPIDYSKLKKDRRKLTNYLRTGNFRKIAGTPIFNRTIRHHRLWLAVSALTVIAIGMYFVIF
jgi:hypothetical protein